MFLMSLSLSYLRPALILVTLLTAFGFLGVSLYNFGKREIVSIAGDLLCSERESSNPPPSSIYLDNGENNPNFSRNRKEQGVGGGGRDNPGTNLLDMKNPPRRLKVPLTIVTAASENHLCSLEAFLYDLDRVFAQMGFNRRLALLEESTQKGGSASGDGDGSESAGWSRKMRIKSLKRLRERIQNGQRYIETSSDLAILRKNELAGRGKRKGLAPKKKDRIQERQVDKEEEEEEEKDGDEDKGAQDQDQGQEQDDNDNNDSGDDDDEDEVWPRLIVYNLGMGIKLRKLRRFQALIEAGYIDELYDFDFDQHPDFWRLGTPTRGQYGWKAGIQEEVSQRMLAQQTQDKDIDVSSREAKSRLRKSKVLPLDITKNSSSRPENLFSSNHLRAARDEYSSQQQQQQQQQQSKKPQILLWLDSGDRLSLPLLRWLPTSASLSQLGVWTPQSEDTFQKWTHPGLLEYFDDAMDNFIPSETNCNGAVMAWDLTHRGLQSVNRRRDQSLPGNTLFLDWIACARDEACIAPAGSSRENHRQDQAALTYLIKKHFNSTSNPVHEGQDRVCFGMPTQFGMLLNQDRKCNESIERNPNRVKSD